MGWVALDANVLAELCGSGESTMNLSLLIGDRKRRGDLIVVVPQIITECEQAGERTANRLLVAIKTWCDGVVSRDAKDVLTTDLVLPNPFQSAVQADLLPAHRILEARKSRKKEKVQGFLHAQRLGYEELRGMMPNFDQALRKVGKYSVEPFSDFVAERQWVLFEAFVRYCVENRIVRIHLPTDRIELERLWRKGLAFPLLILMYAANEYRCGARLPGKLEGCMTDLRVLMESAYVDEIVTMDKELFACGELLRSEGMLTTPRFTLWKSA